MYSPILLPNISLMAVSDLVAFVDVGSARIKTLVGSFIVDQENPTRPKLNVLGVGVVRSGGIRKGIILDMEEFKKNLDESLTEAENMAGQQFPHVGICLSGTGIQINKSSAMITIPSAEIMQEDVNRVLDMAQNGITLTNQTVLKIIPESFTKNQPERKYCTQSTSNIIPVREPFNG